MTENPIHDEARLVAPWTSSQVEALNAWQGRGDMHPFTCPCGAVLRASPEGWRCDEPESNGWDGPPGRLVQTWAHPFMAEGAIGPVPVR